METQFRELMKELLGAEYETAWFHLTELTDNGMEIEQAVETVWQIFDQCGLAFDGGAVAQATRDFMTIWDRRVERAAI